MALLSRPELSDGWDPDDDRVVTVWEVTQHSVKLLTLAGGEQATAGLLRSCRRWADLAVATGLCLSSRCAPWRVPLSEVRGRLVGEADRWPVAGPGLLQAERRAGRGPPGWLEGVGGRGQRRLQPVHGRAGPGG